MNPELTKRLLKRFPILYQDYYSSMTQSAMCWGFDHGDGWFEIIWQLSLAIEEELKYTWLQKRWFLFKKKFSRWWNRAVYTVSPIRQDKMRQEGSGIEGDPYRWVVIEKAPLDALARLASKLLRPPDPNVYGSWTASLQRLGFKAFVIQPYTGLAVAQVKEKFGTLRFYCGGSETIHKYINLAERLSSVTCEDCGEQGTTAESHGWISTLCDACGNKPEGPVRPDVKGDKKVEQENESQHEVTRTQAEKFENAIRELERVWEQEGLPSNLRKAQIDALRSQLSELREELENMRHHQESDSDRENGCN